MAVKVDIKRTPGKLTMLARWRTTDLVGEVYVRGADNARHAGYMADRGKDPLDVPRIVRDAARNTIRTGVLSFDSARERSAFERAAKFVASWCRNRIATGGLNPMRPATIRKKIWAARVGRASTRFGVPGPYGFMRGNLYHNINGRVREIRGGH